MKTEKEIIEEAKKRTYDWESSCKRVPTQDMWHNKFAEEIKKIQKLKILKVIDELYEDKDWVDATNYVAIYNFKQELKRRLENENRKRNKK